MIYNFCRVEWLEAPPFLFLISLLFIRFFEIKISLKMLLKDLILANTETKIRFLVVSK